MRRSSTTRSLKTAEQMARFPVVFSAPAGIRFQPIDPGEVADRLVELALGEPAGRVPDMGGPRAYELADHRACLPARARKLAADPVTAGPGCGGQGDPRRRDPYPRSRRRPEDLGGVPRGSRRLRLTRSGLPARRRGAEAPTERSTQRTGRPGRPSRALMTNEGTDDGLRELVLNKGSACAVCHLEGWHENRLRNGGRWTDGADRPGRSELKEVWHQARQAPRIQVHGRHL